MEDFSVTIISENGSISKKNVGLFKNKTVLEILTNVLNLSLDEYIIAVRTRSFLDILQSDIIPLKKYPKLKIENTADQFSIPDFSLCILKKSEEDKEHILLYPISVNNDDLIFQPFIYSFSQDDYSKSLSDITSDITDYFGLHVLNAELYLKNQKITNTSCSKFIQKVKQLNDSEIQFRFFISDDAIRKINHRQQIISEMIRTEGEFCRDLALFRNQVGVRLQESHVFSDFEHKTVFGSIGDMLKASAIFTTALSGKNTYSQSIANIILSLIPDLKENFKEYFANFHTKDLIPEIIDRHKNNPQLEAIVHRTFENGASDFQSMAIKPIQHFPRYRLLAVDIQKYTPKSHPDYLLYDTVIKEFDKTIHELNNYYLVREVRFLQQRLKPLKENENKRLNEKGRSLVTKYNVNQGLFSGKNTLYLLSDLILFTQIENKKEVEKFRCRYEYFFFVPVPTKSSIYVYYQNNFELLKFSSNTLMNEMINNVIALRKNAFEAIPEKNNLLKSFEYVLYSQPNLEPMIDSSCCKIGNLIMAASRQLYMTFDTNHESSLSIGKYGTNMNIHSHAKLVSVDKIPIPYIFGGEKFPLPLELSLGKQFVDVKQKLERKNSADDLVNVIPLNEMKEGRMYHTCCSYKKYIVIYGGYRNIKNSKKFFPDVYFYNVETCEIFVTVPCQNKEPESRYNHSAVVYKNLMIIHGGRNSRNGILNDTWCYNFNDGKWTLLDLSRPHNESTIVPRFGHSAVCVNHFMFIIGGVTSRSEASNVIKNELMNNNNNDSESSKEEEESDVDKITNWSTSSLIFNSNYIPAPNCFCLNIERGDFINVNLIGNFLPGLSLFSTIYDDCNKQILVFGGSDIENAFKRNPTSVMIISRISVPNRFTLVAPYEGDIDVEKISSSTSTLQLKHRKSHAQLKIPIMSHDDKKTQNEDQERRRKIEKSPSDAIFKKPSTPKARRVVFHDDLIVKQDNGPQTPKRPGPAINNTSKHRNHTDDNDNELLRQSKYADDDDDDKKEIAFPKLVHDDQNVSKFPKFDQAEEDITEIPKLYQDDNDSEKKKSPDGDGTSIPRRRVIRTSRNIKKFKPDTTPCQDDELIPRPLPNPNAQVHKRRHSDMLSSSKKGL